jgi:transposase
MEPLVSLSPMELRRLAALERVIAGDLTQVRAAELLGISYRQVKRLVRAFRRSGPAGLASNRRGRPSNRRYNPELLAHALAIVREHYDDFGPTLAAEKLAERHAIAIDHETLRRAMIREASWIARPRTGPKPHLPRLRRDCFGELIQIDGSHHNWFEKRGPKCCLYVAIDDATKNLVGLHLAPTETTIGYFALFTAYLQEYGRPLSVYSDRSGIFRATKETADGAGSQFGRALNELDIELICAQSPQAKGRVERVHGTLQDRLVKELRLRNISTIEAANVFLNTYRLEHNRRFATPPRSDFNAHRPLEPQHDLERILSCRFPRLVSAKGIVSFENRLFAIDYRIAQHLRSRTVEVRVDRLGRIVIEQGEVPLRFAELPNPQPKRAVTGERADRRIPNPMKAHTPAPKHPWRQSRRFPTPSTAP